MAPAIPTGWPASEIPLGARIVALADAYDVIVRGRPYQAARSHPEAVTELRRCAGSQFDPALVPAVHRGDRTTRVGRATDRRAAAGGAARPRPAHRAPCRCRGLRPSSDGARRRARAAAVARTGRLRRITRPAGAQGCCRGVRPGARSRAPSACRRGRLHRLLQPPELARPHRHRRHGGRTSERLLYIFGPREEDMSRGHPEPRHHAGLAAASRSSRAARTRSTRLAGRWPCCARAACSPSLGRGGCPITRARHCPSSPAWAISRMLARVPDRAAVHRRHPMGPLRQQGPAASSVIRSTRAHSVADERRGRD